MVSPTYEHDDKELVAGEQITAAGARLKWYAIARAGQQVPAAISEEARAFIARQANEGALRLDGELGFVILHRCGEHFYFLIISTWRGNNEVWETVYYKDGGAFALWPRDDNHKPTFCVWELGAVMHESQAWKTYLRSARDEAAKSAYLQNLGGGLV